MLRYVQKRLVYEHAEVWIGKKRLDAMVADSSMKRMIGLMYRKSIARDGGMLFVFDEIGRHGIWMRNMLFPIDVIWLDDKKRIVDFVQRIRPCGTLFGCRTYYPVNGAKYILELRSGFIKENRVEKNSTLKFKLGIKK